MSCLGTQAANAEEGGRRSQATAGTEAEWFACTNPSLLAGVVRGWVNRVRFREMALRWVELSGERRWADRTDLFLRYVHWLRGETAHPRANAPADSPVLYGDASYGAGEYESNAAVDRLVWDDDALSAVAFAGTATIDLRSRIAPPYTTEDIQAAQRRKDETSRRFAAEFRDVAGNPFRPVVWQPQWNTETAVALARGIETERAFDRMPILADALEDAGCDSQQVLQHCRNESVHVVGCWVVSSVLGREL
jgi:hypothetical protein